MTLFRPCIDLHNGQVKQIVGGSLSDKGATTNFVSDKDAAFYAKLYKDAELKGGHIISLGPGNTEQVKQALAAYPDGLQFGGGVTPDNAQQFLDWGASHIIVTSYIFDDDQLSLDKVKALSALVGKDKLVLDLSCRKTDQGWQVATNRWQTVTSTVINQETMDTLSQYCDEFLVHAADVEGLQQGIDEALVQTLAKLTDLPMTYAGGAKSLDDLARVNELSKGKVDLTIGSALDIFGGQHVSFSDCLRFNEGSSSRA